MRINTLELFNFRNIETSHISFKDKKFVVLIGDNGSGKTALLESVTKVFAPILRTVNQDAMKECDLTNTDIMYGMAGVRTALERMIKGYSNLRMRIELSPSRMVMTNADETGSYNGWTPALDEIETELKKIALKLVSFFEADSDTQSHNKEAAS